MNSVRESLPDNPLELKKSLLAKDRKIARLEQQLAHMEEYFRLQQHRRFGASSEKSPGQGELFDEAEAADTDLESEPDFSAESTPAKKPTNTPKTKPLHAA